MSKIQNNLTCISKTIDLLVYQQNKTESLQSPYRIVDQDYEHSKLQERLEEEIDNYRQELKQLEMKLLKEQELTFILKNYFRKIETVVYNGSSNIFNQDHLDYEKVELYLRQLIRRMQDINNRKLDAPPRIYKNSNIKTYRLEPKQPSAT